MSDRRVQIEAVLDREADTVSILLRDIPMEHLEKVLRDVSTSAWRTNVIDGIRGQYIAGDSLNLSQTQRSFQANADEEEI